MSSYSPTPESQSKTSSSDFSGKTNGLKKFWKGFEGPFLIMLSVAALILGVIGSRQYFILHGKTYTTLRTLFTAAELFHMEGANPEPPITWEFETARWLALFVTTYAVLLGLGAIFRNQVQGFRLRIASNHVVLCGLGQKGLLLSKNLHAEGKLVAVIEQDGNNPYIQSCRNLGIVVIIGEARDEYILKKAGIHRAKYLICVCGEDGTNADIAIKARRLVLNKTRGELNCAVHIQDPQLWVYLRQQEFINENQKGFRLDFFNIYANGARQILDSYPIFRSGSKLTNRPPHLLIIELGTLGEQLVIHAARQWYLKNPTKSARLRISVIDPHAEQKIKTLCQQYSLVKKVCQFDPYPWDLLTPAFPKSKILAGSKTSLKIDFVYICLENETLCLTNALALLQSLPIDNTQILVRMQENTGLATILQSLGNKKGDHPNLFAFGLLERICNPKLLNDGSHEALARAIHAEYLKLETDKGNSLITNPSMVPWEELNEGIRDMNRDQADEIGIKLKAIGCDILPWYDHGAEKFQFTKEELELLSKLEHERWCKQKMRQGWKYNDIRNDKKKQHPSLVNWNDPRLSEIEKDKDRNTVLKIPRFLALAGFQIFRQRQIAG